MELREVAFRVAGRDGERLLVDPTYSNAETGGGATVSAARATAIPRRFPLVTDDGFQTVSE